ncbi:MAG: MBL fold metallo-hydrolase [bacterium]|nr:MBL fold metallo-hydrolase [bacterium]
MKDVLLPLGGAHEIGASSYLVTLQGTNLLLDCGAKIENGVEVFPNYKRLLERQVYSYEELDGIIISHAHYDHMGSLFEIARLTRRTPIYTTYATKEFIRLQLLTFERGIDKSQDEKMQGMRKKQLQSIINRIQVVSVLKPFKIGQCSITLYPAGHMPGACMVGIETSDKSVLYTGDFSELTIGQINVKNLNGFHPDILIMNATYGYQSDKGLIQTKLFDAEAIKKQIVQCLAQGKRVLIKSNSIPKHLNLFFVLKDMEFNVPMYITETSKMIQEALAELRFNVHLEGLLPAERLKESMENELPHVLIGSREYPGYHVISFDQFSLHAKYSELINLVYQCAPKKVYCLHANVQPDALNFMDEMKYQCRYNGEMVQCYNEQYYAL